MYCKLLFFLVLFCQWNLIDILISPHRYFRGLMNNPRTNANSEDTRARKKPLPTFHSLSSLVETTSGDVRYAVR